MESPSDRVGSFPACVHRIELNHTFDSAHRVVGHEGGKGKCARLHGHTYSVTVTIDAPELDATGFVVDFGAIKRALDEWDHRTLLWNEDPLVRVMRESGHAEHVVQLGFNPTAENMARALARRLRALAGDEATCTVTVRETPKSAAVWREAPPE